MIYIILVFALILRLVNLNQSLWLDEAVQAITAQNSLSYIFQEIRGDFHPPLFYFLMHFWVRVFGSSEITLRIPSVLFGVGTVYLIYKINELTNYGLKKLRVNGLIGAVFLATAPYHIYYSQEARMYSMACFFATLSMYFFVKINGLTKLRISGLFLLYLLSTILMIYSDYYGFLVLLAQGIYLLLKKQYKFLLIAYCLLLIAYLPWFPVLVIQLKTGMLATRSLPEWSNLVNVSFLKAIPLTFIKFTIGRITIFDKRVYALVSLVILGIIGAIGGYGILSSKFKVQSSKLQLKIQNYNILILLWLLVPLIVSWVASLFVPNYQPFRLLLILPAFYLLITFGISLVRTKKIYIIVVSLLIGINLVCTGIYLTNSYFHREDWRGVVKYVGNQKDTLVILPSETSTWPIKYYDPENKINLINVSKGVNQVNSDQLSVIGDQLKKTNNEKIYYIRYLVPLFDQNERIFEELKAEGYTKQKEISFNQVPVWEYVLTD